MFAVPGWAVSPASLVQESYPKHITENNQASASSASSTAAVASKKRRATRLHRDQASKVSGAELERLWNQRSAFSTDPDDTTEKKHRPKPGHAELEHEPSRGQNSEAFGKKSRKRKNKDRTVAQEDAGPKPEAVDETDGRSNRHSLSATTSSPAFARTLPPAPPTTTAKLTPLQAKMRSKLTSARFRHLNETLYTTSSSAAMDLFSSSPDLFAEYHAGFSQQVKDSWPVNPVDRYISAIKSRGQIPLTAGEKRSISLPRRKTGTCTIADLGCGDAPLARGCQSITKHLKLKFHNFDLHASNSLVTKADISSLPLRDGEADIVVFCLSLMGTNWLAFVEEAWRVLRGDGKGEVWVSEVKSRFGRVGKSRRPGEAVDNSVGKKRKGQKISKNDDFEGGLPGDDVLLEDSNTTIYAAGDETDISSFAKVLSRRGFALREDSVDKSNKMFVSMIFTKSGVPSAGKHKGLKWNGHEYQKVPDAKMREKDEDEMPPEQEAKVLKPCVYKTR